MKLIFQEHTINCRYALVWKELEYRKLKNLATRAMIFCWNEKATDNDCLLSGANVVWIEVDGLYKAEKCFIN